MELGNLFFGNSRGNYPIPDRKLFQDEFCRLYWETEDNKYGFDRYSHFENDVFIHFPYYWGECTCAFDEKDYLWSVKNTHSDECFHKRIWDFYDSLNEDEDESTKLRKFCLENNYNYDDGGCLDFCDCGHDTLYQSWLEENYHDSSCLLIKPNFLHKLTGLEIQWYKYPLRDSYTNEVINLHQLKVIIDECIESLK